MPKTFFNEQRAPSRYAVKRRKNIALDAMGLARGEEYTAEEIKARFKAIARDTHPDAGGAGGNIDAMRKHRDYLLDYFKEKEDV